MGMRVKEHGQYQNSFGSFNLEFGVTTNKISFLANTSTFSAIGAGVLLKSLDNTNVKIETAGEGILDVDINADILLSGFIIVDKNAYQGSTAGVGDAADDKPRKAYLSFDISSISSLDYVTIKDVSVTIPVTLIISFHSPMFSEVIISSYSISAVVKSVLILLQ